MALKKQLLNCLEHGKKVELEFIAGLTDEQRAATGTYENWSPKDILAHLTYYQERRTELLDQISQGEQISPQPANYEHSNIECFELYRNSSWDEIQQFAEQTLSKLAEAVQKAEGKILADASPYSEDRKLWDHIVGTAYTHPLSHIAEHYTEQGQPEKAGQLWREWGKYVSPLDDSPSWQGGVHYNIACSLALTGNQDQAIAELRKALKLRPDLTAWSRQDSDLDSLHNLPEYKQIYAPEFWWKALEANPTSEALADQFMRSLVMLREAINAFPTEGWREGNSTYQRPAGLALHIINTIHGYCALKTGEYTQENTLDVSWEVKDSSKLPSQDTLLEYLNKVEQKLARFLFEADLLAPEDLFPWTGSTKLSRALYTLRHTQHHLAEMCLELHIRGLKAPQWQ